MSVEKFLLKILDLFYDIEILYRLIKISSNSWIFQFFGSLSLLIKSYSIFDSFPQWNNNNSNLIGICNTKGGNFKRHFTEEKRHNNKYSIYLI